jgi:pyruvate/2-oxoglutarate dehydrogenase complex dihydrolipoamide dehydrogenase (E3) component
VATFSSKLQQKNGSSFTESFDTVLTSVGRIAHVDGLGLEKLGLLREESTGRIIVDESDATSMPGT